MQAVHFDAVEKQLPADSALMSTTPATAPAATSPAPASAPEAPPCALHTGLEGVPVKFVLVRRGVVVERRRTRLVSPTFEDVKRCARQWACGDFGVRYVDDEGDVVSVDVEEEWAECVSLWCQQAGSGARPPLCLEVEVRDMVHSPAAPRHPQPHAMGWWQLLRHHARMRVAADSLDKQEQQACCRRSASHPGKHGRRCSNAKTDSDTTARQGEAGGEGECTAPGAGHRHHPRSCGMRGEEGGVKPTATRSAVCAAEGCTRTVGGLRKAHCCRRCAEEGGHPHAHGPRCQRRADAQAAGKVAATSSSDAETQPRTQASQEPALGQAAGEPQVCCAGCGFQVTGIHTTHCCRRCAKKGGQHGLHCARRVFQANVGTQETEEADHLVADPKPKQAPAVPVVEVPVVCADPPESDAVCALQQMGFEMTDAVRVLLRKHNGDMPRVLEELL